MLKKLVALFLSALFLQGFVSVDATDGTAEELIKQCFVTADGKNASYLTDNNIYTYLKVNEVEIKSDTPLYGVYILFDRTPAKWKLCVNGNEQVCGEKGFLHEFVELDGVTEIRLVFGNGEAVADIFVYGKGILPDTVQRWELLERADIMICPTHSDDDQLYFAGMIPWCTAMGYDVQIVYFTNHWNTHDRPHELLNGLWHCGLTYYPYISEHPDLYSQSLSEAEQAFNGVGLDKSHFVEFYVDLLQRYQPLVVAGHDQNGEYGHGVHMLNSTVLMEAVSLSAERGLWDVPKTYIHLWKENQAVFNWDIPMEELGGKTPFEVSQEGYGFHYSQHRFEGLSRWLYGTEGAPITKASHIYSYSPCRYGLFRSTVGVDSTENSLFENVKSYKEQQAEQAPPKDEPTVLPEDPPEEEKTDYPSLMWAELKREEYSLKIQLQKPLSFTAEQKTQIKAKQDDLTAYLAVSAVSVVILAAAIVITRKKQNDFNNKNKAENDT